MNKKIVGIILQIPAWLLIAGSVVAGFYAWMKKINGIGFGVPIILLIIVILYALGRFLVMVEKEDAGWQSSRERLK
jgi:uncharacterized sodium:solute symporter family permease YidK